jgi:hypothetical protein
MKIIYVIFFVLCLLILVVRGWRKSDGSDPLVPDYAEFYYYRHIDEKMTESMSINNCSLYGSTIPIGKEYGGATTMDSADLSVEIVPPPAAVIARWQPQADGKASLNLYCKGNENLCSSIAYRDFKRGFFKLAKGCLKTHIIDPNTNQKIRRIKRYGATLHPDHIRCDIPPSAMICGKATKRSAMSQIVPIPPKLRLLHEYPFIIKAKNVIVAKSGMLALPCGPFGLLSSCEAVNWGVSTAAPLVDHVSPCREHYSSSSSTSEGGSCPFRRIRKLFLMSQYDDTQIGQFMMESFPRLVYHLDYLRKNPDVLIHFGFTKRESVPSFTLPNIFINWLGLGDRLVNGTFYADEVIMSREGGCQDAGYNAWEVVTMRDRFISMLGLPSDTDLIRQHAQLSNPRIVILTRSRSRFVQNKGDAGSRGWPNKFIDDLRIELEKYFPRHQIDLFSDANATLMTSPSEQIALFRRADIAIGYHGAGLSNTMYMKPGSVVVEILPYFDSRLAPGTGIFPRLSGIIGLHHYSYYIPGMSFTPERLTNDTYHFYSRVKMWS